jgi:hypothetical protein
MWMRVAACAVAVCLPLAAQDEEGVRGPVAGGASTAAAPVEGTYEGRPVRFGRYHALLIGINRYREASPLPDLNGPVSDVDDLRALLTEQFGFHVTVLKDAEATKEGILAAIRAYQKRPSRELPEGVKHTPLGEDENLLVWYAGHGRQGEGDGQGYWLPYGVSTDSASWLSFEEVRRELGRVAVDAAHVLLVSDSCFSGGLSSDTQRAEAGQRPLDEILRSRSFQIITSGDLQVVTDVYKHGNSPFASAFKASLRSIEHEVLVTGRPFKTASEIAAEVRERVTGQTPTSGQVSIEGQEGAPGEFAFALRSYFLSADELNRNTSRLLRKVAEAKGQLPDGRFLFTLKESRDDGVMVLVEGSLARRRPVRPFLVDREEVTVGGFRRFLADHGDVGKLPYLNLPHYADPGQPIVGVSFEAARAYAAWAGKSLPTEAEWQAAAGYVPDREELRKYPWGDELPADPPVWTAFPPPAGAPTFDVSPWGALRMATGVREWCQTNDEAFDRAVLCGGTEVPGSIADRPDPDDPKVPEASLRCTYRSPTAMILVPYRNVGFRCIKRLH